jgi:hypothetical protein
METCHSLIYLNSLPMHPEYFLMNLILWHLVLPAVELAGGLIWCHMR